MKLRYRDLSNRIDPAAIADLAILAQREAKRRHEETPLLLRGRHGDGAELAAVGQAIAGIVSAPRKVSVVEGEAELDELRRMLTDGRLQPEDLVDDGTGWTTFAAHPLFADEAEAQRRPSMAVIVLVGIGLLVLAGVVARLIS